MSQWSLKKSGATYLSLCKILLDTEVGARLPSIAQLVDLLSVSRGTVHNTISLIESNGLIKLNKSGRNGTTLAAKDEKGLFSELGITHLWGVMPIPYTLRYEGLGTGIKLELQKQLEINVSLSYMKNANERIQMLKDHRVDFGVFSVFHANKIIANHPELKILCNFGNFTYLSAHTKVEKKAPIKTVGIDANSYVHGLLTENHFQDINLIHMEYSRLKDALINGKIDGAILNLDDIFENDDFSFTEIKQDYDFLNASIIINQNNNAFKNVVNIPDFIKGVQEIQDKVLKEEMDPNF